MAVRDFRDLVCWQLSHELRSEVFAFTAIGPASRDFEFRDQIRGSSASTPRNIAEGFGRFTPGEFAQFLKYARASLMETRASLIEARDAGYLETQLYWRLANLARAALRATTNLMLAKLRQAGRKDSSPGRGARRRRTTPRHFDVDV
jgi:four helix bundle protein